MAYDDSRFRGQPGFREEPDFRTSGVPEDAPMVSGASIYTPGYTSGAYPVGEYGSDKSESTVGLGNRRSPSAAQLDQVFDDPEHGDPGRDRMIVHVMWEVVLLLGVIVVAYLVRDADPAALRGDQLENLLVFGAVVGLAAVGMGLSLRAAAPNLALGPLVFATALFFADNSGRGLLVTAGITALLAAVVGAVIAVLVVGFHVPAWAASLGVALGVMVWIGRAGSSDITDGAYKPTDHALYWFVGFIALALIGGLFGLVKPVRRSLGRFRPIGDPALRRGGVAAALVVAALVGSCVLAAAAGVLYALQLRVVPSTENGFDLTGLALGAALLGGTSAFGRRGGVLGTALAVTLIVFILKYSDIEGWGLSALAVGTGTILAGLVVTRLVESFGRPPLVEEEEVEQDEEWSSSTATGGGERSWSTSRSGGWTSQLPARATDEGWGGAEQGWGTR